MIPGPPKTQTLDLDDAIHWVASRMTRVEEDAQFAQRIVSALPERGRSLRWMVAPALASLAIAVLVLRTFDGGSTQVLRTEKIASTSVPPSVVASAVVEPSQNRTSVVERSPNRRRTFVEPSRVDHDRALPPLAAVAALSVDSVEPSSLPDEAPLVIAPLAIADLALDPVQR
jgi:hypothetical protein